MSRKSKYSRRRAVQTVSRRRPLHDSAGLAAAESIFEGTALRIRAFIDRSYWASKTESLRCLARRSSILPVLISN